MKVNFDRRITTWTVRQWIPSPARGDKLAVDDQHFTTSESCFFARTRTAGSFGEQIHGQLTGRAGNEPVSKYS